MRLIIKMTRPLNWPSGVTAVATSTGQNRLFWASLFMAAVITGVLNLDSILVRDLYFWPRLVIPASLFVGLVGAFQKSRIFSILMSTLVWLGIGFFFLLVITSRVPGELIRATDNPQGPSGTFLAIRFVLLMSLGIAFAVLFFRLKKAAADTVSR